MNVGDEVTVCGHRGFEPTYEHLIVARVNATSVWTSDGRRWRRSGRLWGASNYHSKFEPHLVSRLEGVRRENAARSQVAAQKLRSAAGELLAALTREMRYLHPNADNERALTAARDLVALIEAASGTPEQIHQRAVAFGIARAELAATGRRWFVYRRPDDGAYYASAEDWNRVSDELVESFYPERSGG